MRSAIFLNRAVRALVASTLSRLSLVDQLYFSGLTRKPPEPQNTSARQHYSRSLAGRSSRERYPQHDETRFPGREKTKLSKRWPPKFQEEGETLEFFQHVACSSKTRNEVRGASAGTNVPEVPHQLQARTACTRLCTCIQCSMCLNTLCTNSA